MPFNGSGAFTRAYNWVSDKIVTRGKIRDSRFDAECDNVANGLSAIMTKDGQSGATGKVTFPLGVNIAASAPSTPEEGDLWIESDGLHMSAEGRDQQIAEKIGSGTQAAATAHNFDFPSGTKRIRYVLTNISIASTADIVMQLKSGGSVQTSAFYAYASKGQLSNGSAVNTNGFNVASGRLLPNANTTHTGGLVLLDFLEPENTTRRKPMQWRTAHYYESLGSGWLSQRGLMVWNLNTNAIQGFRLSSSAAFSFDYDIFQWR